MNAPGDSTVEVRGDWIVPAGVAAAPDEFGSDVAIVVVASD